MLLPDDTDLQVEQRTPCPSCQSTDRRQQLAAVNMVATLDLVASADLILGPGPRPWTEQWHVLQQAYAELRSFFGTPDRTAEQFKVHGVVNHFMTTCYHLKDYLKSDPSVPPAVRQVVESFVSSTQHVLLAGDVANTSKHRERRPGQRYARVGEIRTGPKAVLHWDVGSGGQSAADVVVVADAAMQEWEAFLRGHRLLA